MHGRGRIRASPTHILLCQWISTHQLKKYTTSSPLPPPVPHPAPPLNRPVVAMCAVHCPHEPKSPPHTVCDTPSLSRFPFTASPSAPRPQPPFCCTHACSCARGHTLFLSLPPMYTHFFSVPSSLPFPFPSFPSPPHPFPRTRSVVAVRAVHQRVSIREPHPEVPQLKHRSVHIRRLRRLPLATTRHLQTRQTDYYKREYCYTIAGLQF